jgi:hypothetical protein
MDVGALMNDSLMLLIYIAVGSGLAMGTNTN